jgi:hypothetical protein
MKALTELKVTDLLREGNISFEDQGDAGQAVWLVRCSTD